jgi:hypothetical protein
MKKEGNYISRLLAVFVVFITFVNYVSARQNTLREQMYDVNSCWNSFDPILPELEMELNFYSDRDRIKKHLQLVEGSLRSNLPRGISTEQLKRREDALDILKAYWQKGIFPQNTGHLNRTPYFIDHRGVACAVGYLIISSGQAELSYEIARKNNNSYLFDLADMYPAISQWADFHGFTLKELAWIQPGYQFYPNYCQRECYYNFAIDVFGSDPKETFTYFWYHVDSNRYINDRYLPLACSGNTYIAYALDTNGDTVSADRMYLGLGFDGLSGNILKLPEPRPLELAIQTTNDDGSCSGSVITTVVTGSPPINQAWARESPNQGPLDSLCEGFHILLTRDSLLCFVRDTFEILRLDDISIIPDRPIFANPIQKTLTLQLSDSTWEGAKLSLRNSSGVEVLETIINLPFNKELDHLSTGCYYLRLESGLHSFRRTIIIE